MSYLDRLLSSAAGAVVKVFRNGSQVTARDAIDLKGSGVSAADNPGTGRTDVTIPGLGDALTSSAPATIGTANAVGTGTTAARSDHVHAHGNQTSGTLHALAVAGASHGFLDKDDKTVIDAAVTTAGNGLRKSGRTLTVPNADGSISATADDLKVGVLATNDQHGALGYRTTAGDPHHQVVDDDHPGFMSSAEHTKLNNYPAFSALFTPDVNTFNPVITVAEPFEAQVIGASSGAVILRLAQSGHVDGCQLRIVCPIGHATSIAVPADLHVSGDGFTPTEDWILDIECDSEGLTTPAFKAIAHSLPARDRTAPTVTAASIGSGTPDQLSVSFSEPVHVASLTGLSLTGTTPTISSVLSGNGTSTVVFQLSGNVSGTDVITFVYGGTNTITDLMVNALASSSHAVTNNVTSFTGLVARYRLDSATLSGSNVTQIADTSGNSNTITFASSKQPVITATNAAVNNQPTCKFDGSDDVGQCSSVLVGGSNPADYAELTIAMVVKLNSAANAYIVHLSDATGAVFLSFDLLTDTGTLYWDVGGSANACSKASPTTGSFISLIVTLAPTNGGTEIFINGSSVGTQASGHNPVAIRKLSIGASYSLLAGYFSQMDLAEVLIADHQWSAGERTTWATYINGRYGL